MASKRRGFTLIELLIVIAIIGILIASIAVAVTKAKEFANNSDQKNNMKQLVTACRVAEGFNGGRLPPAYGAYGQAALNSKSVMTQPVKNIFVHMLPYLENKPLYDAYARSQSGITNTPQKIYHSAMDPSLPAKPTYHGSFVANIRMFQGAARKKGWNVGFETDASRDDGGTLGSEKIPDGASNTIFFATKYAVCTDPTNTIQTQYSAAPGNGVGTKDTNSATDKSPFFGAGSYAVAGVPAAEMPTQPAPYSTPYPGPYQIAPSLSGSAKNYCNNDDSIFGHSYGSTPMAVAMGDTSVRNLSFMITGGTYASALDPTDGKPLGSDW